MNFRFLLFFFFFLLCGSRVPAAPSTAEVERLRMELEELRMVVRTLRTENEKLETRNLRLMEDIRLMGRQIQELRPQPVSTSATLNVRPEAKLQPAGLPIVYVNAEMHIMIVEGSTAGLKVGDLGRVIREGGELLGTVKVTDVKAMQAVVDLDPATLAPGGLYPKAGDRVLIP